MIYKQSTRRLACTVFLSELAFCRSELCSRKSSTRVREQCMLAGAVFVAVSVPAEHRRIGKHACIMLSKDMLRYRNAAIKRRSKSGHQMIHFSSNICTALLLMEIHRLRHSNTIRQLGQGVLNMKFTYSYGVLQPDNLNVKFLKVCFSTYTSILHRFFFFPCF